MKYEDIDKWNRYPHKLKCKCEKSYTILTEIDNKYEIHENIYILCECGDYVKIMRGRESLNDKKR